jgi:hypothetical protein
MSKTMYRLPDSTITFNRRIYLRAWHKMAKPIATATNSRLTGFNPGLQFTTNDKLKYNWQLDWYVACMLSKALTHS